MAYITTITFDGNQDGEPWLIYKYPSEQFAEGTRLVVKQGQEALLFKGRKDFEVYQSGIHMIHAENAHAASWQVIPG